GGGLPHLVAVQSESFFDPRPLYSGIRRDILAGFDRLKSSALMHGSLSVPAWGANTVRTEFAFLSGLHDEVLGVHRFNPFRAVAGGWEVPSLASFLKSLGYRTVCVHPYPASFYRRHRVYPRLGFDEFIDMRSFAGAPRCGPYVADAAVASMVARMLGKASAPLFVFAITMENHGPLHLEKVDGLDVAELYTLPPPPGCDDLTIYLRHLRNADRMIHSVREALEACSRAAGLCWFGDHVPIMPGVYDRHGAPEGHTPFLCWSNVGQRQAQETRVAAHQLPLVWLRAMGLTASVDGDHFNDYSHRNDYSSRMMT
ncbi:MAG: LTA synthase family protein, partial [Pseudomonadota bacterium]